MGQMVKGDCLQLSLFDRDHLMFSKYKSFVSLVRYIPKDFILSVAMVNATVSLISLCFLIVSV